MKVLIAASHGRRLGGLESYIEAVAEALHCAGFELAFLHEYAGTSGAPTINLPEGVPAWCVQTVGKAAALSQVGHFAPDIIYAQGFDNQHLEQSMLGLAPSVRYVHSYWGTCISGDKSFKRPNAQPCHRPFSAGCLMQYHVRRCGGLNPVTMLRLYHTQADRLELLRQYEKVLSNSEYMARELRSHGIAACCLYPFAASCPFPDDVAPRYAHGRLPSTCSLLYLGRLEAQKGGDVLIEALPHVHRQLKRKLRLIVAGSGTRLSQWKELALRVERNTPNIGVEFRAWVSETARDAILAESDVLVIPSLWPEPFGLVGIEAGLHALPAAAFAVGGIPEWLRDGVNGYLAPGAPPTAKALAHAIVRVLISPEDHARLRIGAVQQARLFSRERHIKKLMEFFGRIGHGRTASSEPTTAVGSDCAPSELVSGQPIN